MSTWHQQQNPTNLQLLWKPEPGLYKCVSDKPNQTASCMVFDNEAQARAYCQHTGDVLVMPPKEVK